MESIALSGMSDNTRKPKPIRYPNIEKVGLNTVTPTSQGALEVRCNFCLLICNL